MLIGQILKHLKYCTDEDIMKVIEMQKNGDKRRFGQILIEEGIITQMQLVEALKMQQEYEMTKPKST